MHWQQTEQTRKISEDDSLLQVHADLKRQLFSAQDAVSKAAGKSDAADKVASLRDEVIRLDKNIQSVKFAIEEKYPGYFNVKYGYKPVDLAQVQKMMTAKDQVLLEYFWGKKSVYALGVNDKIVSFKRIGSPDSIQVVVNELLAHFTDPRSGMTQDVFNSFKKSAGALYQMMIKPFDDLLATKKTYSNNSGWIN